MLASIASMTARSVTGSDMMHPPAWPSDEDDA